MLLGRHTVQLTEIAGTRTVSEAQSPREWLRLAEAEERAARALAEDRRLTAQAILHVGFAVEYALKAYIMHRERLNAWPSREARKDLYTHDIRKLKEIAGIDVDSRSPTGPAWFIMCQWDRGQAYNPKPPLRRVARDYIRAAFGEQGVVTWIRSTLNRTI